MYVLCSEDKRCQSLHMSGWAVSNTSEVLRFNWLYSHVTSFIICGFVPLFKNHYHHPHHYYNYHYHHHHDFKVCESIELSPCWAWWQFFLAFLFNAANVDFSLSSFQGWYKIYPIQVLGSVLDLIHSTPNLLALWQTSKLLWWYLWWWWLWWRLPHCRFQTLVSLLSLIQITSFYHSIYWPILGQLSTL